MKQKPAPKTVKATAYGPKGSTFKCNWLRLSLGDLQRLTAYATLKGWPEVDITHFTETGVVHFWPPSYVTKRKEERPAFEAFNNEPANLQRLHDVKARLDKWVDQTREAGSPAPWPWDANGNPIDKEKPQP